MNIEVKSKFKNLIPPLSQEEFRQLEENVLREGILEPLTVWNGILVDGHNRYEIANKHGLPFQVREVEFDSESDAEIWIIKNQFGRRNLSKYDRSILALKMEPMIAKKAKENQGTRNDICQKSDKSLDTKKELAKIAGVSHDTIHRVKVIEQKASEKLKQQVRSGEKSINEAYLAVTPKPKTTAQEAREAREKHDEFQQKKSEGGTLSFREIKEDAYNVRIIGRDFYGEILSAVQKVNGLSLFRDQTDIDATIKTIPQEQRKRLGDSINNSVAVLQFLKKKITEVK